MAGVRQRWDNSDSENSEKSEFHNEFLSWKRKASRSIKLSAAPLALVILLA
jgi:hypothetical protein